MMEDEDTPRWVLTLKELLEKNREQLLSKNKVRQIYSLLENGLK